MESSLLMPKFHLDLWVSFTIQNWLLDFGRPIVMVSEIKIKRIIDLNVNVRSSNSISMVYDPTDYNSIGCRRLCSSTFITRPISS